MQTHDLASITAHLQARRQRGCALVVAVDGPSGSGKTRLARRLGRALGEHTLVRMDHVVPGWDGLEESVGLIRPAIADLRSGHSTSYRMWDWQRGDWGQHLSRAAAPTVVLEGCGSGALALADLVDALVWVDAPEDVRRTRAIERDGQTYAGHWGQWADQETAHFTENHTRERADIRLDGRRPVR